MADPIFPTDPKKNEPEVVGKMQELLGHQKPKPLHDPQRTDRYLRQSLERRTVPRLEVGERIGVPLSNAILAKATVMNQIQDEVNVKMDPPRSIFHVVIYLPEKEMAQVWCVLNDNYWPPQFPVELRPGWWEWSVMRDRLRLSDRRHGYVTPIMEFIAAVLGEQCLRDAWAEYLHSDLPAEVALKDAKENDGQETQTPST